MFTEVRLSSTEEHYQTPSIDVKRQKGAFQFLDLKSLCFRRVVDSAITKAVSQHAFGENTPTSFSSDEASDANGASLNLHTLLNMTERTCVSCWLSTMVSAGKWRNMLQESQTETWSVRFAVPVPTPRRKRADRSVAEEDGALEKSEVARRNPELQEEHLTVKQRVQRLQNQVVPLCRVGVTELLFFVTRECRSLNGAANSVLCRHADETAVLTLMSFLTSSGAGG